MIIFLISFIIILILLYYVSIIPIDSVLDRFTNKIPVITGFFIGGGLLLTYYIFNISVENIRKDLTYKIIDRGWLNINQKFMENYGKCPNFIESLYFSWQKNNLEFKISSQPVNKYDDWYAVNYLSILIFQSFEDYLIVQEHDETGDYVWINNYLQWVNSPILENRWSVLKTNFAKTTIKLGDLLFSSIKNKNINNVADLANLADSIVNSEQYKQIVYKRNLI